MIGRAGARLLRATVIVDRAYEYYCRARSLFATALLSDDVLGAYNDLAHGQTPVYDAGSPQFRESLFLWEEEMVRRVFPPPPCCVLVGGAGGGREAFQLAARGYEVVAFEPSETLARSMAHRAQRLVAPVRSYVARYEDLPIVRSTADGGSFDLRTSPRAKAALMGWTSYSHLRAPATRIGALMAMTALTDGPVVSSFYMRDLPMRSRGLGRRLGTLGHRQSGDAFSPHVGFYHWSTREEVLSEVQQAGLVLVDQCWEETDGRWPWVAVASRQASAAGTTAV